MAIPGFLTPNLSPSEGRGRDTSCYSGAPELPEHWECHVEQLPQIYLNILIPVFALVAIGYLVGPRLGLEARAL